MATRRRTKILILVLVGPVLAVAFNNCAPFRPMQAAQFASIEAPSSPRDGSGTGGGAITDPSANGWPVSEKAGSVTLSWVAPAEDIESRPLTDLAGYRIAYSEGESLDPAKIVILDVGSTPQFEIAGLRSGITYTFAVSAYDTSMNESAPSAIATINVR